MEEGGNELSAKIQKVCIMTVVLGIDPGLTGALAVLDSDGKLEVWDIPTHEIEVGKKRKKTINLQYLDRIFADIRSMALIAYIERVGARPKQGVTSCFNFGVVYGALKMGLAAHNFSVNTVEAREWCKVLRVPRGKDGSLLRASELMPSCAEHWPLKKHHNRADAALIAYYGLQRDGAAPVATSTTRRRLRRRVG